MKIEKNEKKNDKHNDFQSANLNLGTGTHAIVNERTRRNLITSTSTLASAGTRRRSGKAMKGGVEKVYGREYAVKCLSKEGMDEEELRAQMVEVRFEVPSFRCFLLLLLCGVSVKLDANNSFSSLFSSLSFLRFFFSCFSSPQPRTPT